MQFMSSVGVYRGDTCNSMVLMLDRLYFLSRTCFQRTPPPDLADATRPRILHCFREFELPRKGYQYSTVGLY